MTDKNGGAAFPRSAFDNGKIRGAYSEAQEGMTLRDWFAGQSLANPYTAHENSPDKTAEWAYQVADAMIAARDK